MGKMFAAERQEQILKKLNQEQRITVRELSKEIHVSEATLRADLDKMEKKGLLKRTHGGAVHIDFSENEQLYTEHHFSNREKQNKNEKNAIAKKALAFIKPGQCIMLDASSTALELAKLLNQSDMRLTIVTNGIQTALELNDHQDITVILLGGIVKKGSHALEGTLGASVLTNINIDILFTSANGFSIKGGLTDFSVYEVELKKTMVGSANKTIALLDHTKMGRNSIASFASVTDLKAIITDQPLSSEDQQQLDSMDIDVIVANQ